MKKNNFSSSDRKISIKILYLLICLTAAAVMTRGIYLFIRSHHYAVTLLPASYTESSDVLSNPYQGWYRIYRYELTEEALFSPRDVEEALLHDPTTRLALLEINLKTYRDTPLSSSALTELKTILDAWSQTNKALILRFLYDWDGNAFDTEPRDYRQIQDHMRQVAPLVNAHADSVYLLQGIFVGNTGEMNQSVYMTPDVMARLMTTLDEVMDPSIFLSVRTPAHYREITGRRKPPAPEEAFTGQLVSRIGLYNDGMMGSESDYGTYGVDELHEMAPLSAKGNRAEESAFQNQLCRFVPNGGEVIHNNPFNDLDMAIPYLETIHVSYLNYDYDPAVLDKWKGESIQGIDGYTYVESHMGYRYFLCHAQLETRGYFAGYADLLLSVDNLGFSNAYRPFTCKLILETQEGDKTFSYDIDTDNRLWNSGERTQLSVSLPLQDLAGETYRAYVALEDPAKREAITFANRERTSYGCFIGSIRVEANSALAK